ncbi:hypothetical protein IMCC21906_02534 [Spongiibacter sp. IMCC21906]|uniref:CvfB family protein n=1 Tax=Spongiibacter sp. IMCC21906 TaxID=1620392 RepID=UPI00062DE1A4|nr:S1-like domain-containing RNA-binding protein [Spongiibacter sp. IMCC21906]AKH70186.1 hypothetical protein IMCC21906_02534 [Spongiibacter sp. IMCC21906]
MRKNPMPEVGKTSTLNVIRESGNGFILDGQELGEIFLGRRQARGDCAPGDTVTVFLYPDADGATTATTLTPKAQLGEVALLKVADVNDTGAFMDWGLEKDLLLPYAEQLGTPRAGQELLIIIYQDKRGRLVASMKLDEFIEDNGPALTPGTEVSIIVANKTELGYKAVINHQRWGLLYDSELRRPLTRGEQLQAYIKKTRDDERVDLTLTAPKRITVPNLSEQILEKLAENDGYLALGDKSPPETIYRIFGESKKSFKQAIGRLYKAGKIAIEERGIRLKQ